jgi:WD40 repeat protein
VDSEDFTDPTATGVAIVVDSNTENRLNEIIAAYLREQDAGRTPDREALLAGHPDLVQELKSFFANQDQINQLAQPVAVVAPPLAPGAIDDADRLTEPSPTWNADDSRLTTRHSPPGTKNRYFGDYELLDEIARGGMGVVYRARQISLNRVVALKMILAGHLASSEEVQRFRREAEAAANLDHANIVPIYEVGNHDGQHYFSMKLIEGGSLAKKIADTAPQEGDRGGESGDRDHRSGVRGLKEQHAAAELIATVARTVHYAHQRGILHRDLKPGNILIDSDGRPHVTDFGLAKRVEEGASLTQSGAVVGTPSYMAPEQAQRQKQLTTKVDVYSLGAILYELLTGRPPFRCETPLETIWQLLEREPDRPSGVNRQINPDLETICLKCLQKEPDRRYGSAEALAEDLERWLAGEPVAARPASALERLIKWTRRRPAVATAYSLVVLVGLLAAGGGSVAWLWRRADDARQVALQAKEDVEREKKLTEMALAGEQQALEREGIARRKLDQLSYLRSVSLAHREWEEANLARADELLTGCREDLRHWEWKYVRRLCSPSATSFKGHRLPVSVVFSRDGSRLSSLSQGRMVVWDLATGKMNQSLEQRVGSATALSPDGQFEATADWDGMVTVWDVATGKQVLSFERSGRGAVSGLAFSPDGKRLSVSNFSRFRVWDLATKKAILEQATSGFGGGVTFSPDGTLVAAVDRGAVRVWEIETGRQAFKLQGHMDPRGRAAFSPDAKFLAIGAIDSTVMVFDLADSKQLFILRGHTARVGGVAFSPDGKRLASAGEDNLVRVWNLETGWEIHSLKGHTDGAYLVTFNSDGTRLASAALDQTILVWDLYQHWDADIMRGRAGVSSIVFTRDGTGLASSHSDGTVGLWDLAACQKIASWTHSESRKPVQDIAVSNDGKLLASAAMDDTVKVWDLATRQVVLTLSGHGGAVESVAFSPHGALLASAGGDGQLKIWDLATGHETVTIKAPRPGAGRVAFSPDGKFLASTSPGDDTVRLWNAATGEPIRTFGNVGGLCIAFSPDNKYLASAGSDRAIRLYDLASGQLAHALKGHLKPVRSIAFSPDGKRLVSGGDGGVITIWALPEGEAALSLSGLRERDHPGVSCVAFSPNGDLLAIASGNGTLRIWDSRPWTPELRIEQEASGLVRYLFEKLRLRGEVIQRIDQDKSMRSDVRVRARKMAEQLREDPALMNETSWFVVVGRGRALEEYSLALKQAETACRLEPDNVPYLTTLGVAQYRVAKYQEAVDTLTRSDKINGASQRGRQPADVGFLAMAQFKLGQKESAQALLGELRQLAMQPLWAHAAQNILREPEEVLAGKQ